MNINPTEIKRQYDRIKAAGWLQWFQNAAQKAVTSTAHLLGIGSRETNLKNIRGDFRGGQYHGFGVMQVDIGTDPDYAKNWTPDKVEPSIRRGGEIYTLKVNQVMAGQGKRLALKGNRFTGKTAEPDDVRRIATAAYNAGLWPYYHFTVGKPIDSSTTGHDYGGDVYDRAMEFAKLLSKDGTEPDALKREIDFQGKYTTETMPQDEPVADQPAADQPSAGDNGVDPASPETPADPPSDKPTEADKGVTTGSDKTADENAAGTPPPAPAADVKASEVSWASRITSVSIPTGVTTILVAIANFVKGLPAYVWVAFAGVVVVAMVIGFVMWRDKNRQAHEKTLKLMDKAADPNQNNLRLV